MSDSDTFGLHDLRVEVAAGAVHDAERDRAGPDGRIMRYDPHREGGGPHA